MKREGPDMTSVTTHNLYTSLDELLSPETLSQIAGHRVTEVDIEEREVTGSASGNRFLSVKTQGEQVNRYIVKRVNWAWDWLMQAFDDRLCREVQLWSSGLFDLLPPELIHATVACAKDGDGWAILMTDYSHLFPDDPRGWVSHTPDEAVNRSYLNALAALHANYLDDPALLDPALGLGEPARYLTALSPQVLANVTGSDLPQIWTRWWDDLDAYFAAETVRIIKGLHEDPNPLCTVLQQLPQTLLHGDCHYSNLVFYSQSPARILAIDWQLAHRGAPVIDLCRYLTATSIVFPVPHEESIRHYRECYELHSGTVLDIEQLNAQVELGVLFIYTLFGGGWTYCLGQFGRTDELPWMERKILAGAARL